MQHSSNGAQSHRPNEGNPAGPRPHHHHHHPHHHHNNNHNNNNNNSGGGGGSRSPSSSNTENSGSQYAMCALGVGLVALGIVMIVWSVVPADGGGKPPDDADGGGGGGGGGRPDNRNKVSSVAFVLVGSGVVMLLLSLCLGIRNKQRELRGLQEAQLRGEVGRAGPAQEDAETAEERAQRFAVPSYEEVVGSGKYPVRHSAPPQSPAHLPSYEDLEDQADGVRFENEVQEGVVGAAGDPASAAAATTAATTAAGALPDAVAPARRAGKTTRKLLPLKIRRIKSEKLHMKNVDNGQAPSGLSIEPLTPPPQYEDNTPPI